MIDITTNAIFGEAGTVLLDMMELISLFFEKFWGISMGKIIISLTLVGAALYLGRVLFLRWGRRSLYR